MIPVKVPKSWDREADIIVVGAGTAGLPAAALAAKAGAKVIVLELMSYCASSLGIITGAITFAGNDYEIQQGIEGSPEQYYRDGVDIAKGSPELWRVYIDHQLDTYRWCKEIGAQLMAGTYANRTLRADGAQVLKCMEKAARDAGAEILFLHRAVKLITDHDTGRVLGLKVTVKDKPQDFKAKKAVILCTGGFGRNKEIVHEYGPEFADCIPYMPPGHLGDGLKMGLAIGAGTRNMGGAVITSDPVDAETKEWNSSHIVGALYINQMGKPYTNEGDLKRFYGLVAKDGLRQPGGLFYRIYDEKGRKAQMALEPKFKKRKPVQGDTLEEVAKKAGIDPKGLKETIEKYNSDIDAYGYDTVMGRKPRPGESLPKIDTPPFYIFRCVATTSSFKGGLKVNTRGQVLTQFDEVIPNLYAAGEVTGGLWSHEGNYFGGSMVPASMTFGRIAASNALTEPAW